MSAGTSYALLHRLSARVLATREVAAALGVSASSASRSLSTLAQQGLVHRVSHGLWSIGPEPLDPLRLASELTRPFPGYISFQSALAARGAIDQIPRDISVASMARSRRVKTAGATFVIHRLPPELIGDYNEDLGFAMATVEKAIFDYFYVACASGHPHRRLPELDLPANFSLERVDEWIERIRSQRLRTLVSAAVTRTLESAEYEAVASSTG